MGRTWTKRQLTAGDVAKSRDLSDEGSAIAREVNGLLDQHNIPIRSITSSKLADAVIEEPGVTLSTYRATRSDHRSVFFNSDPTTPQDALDPETVEYGAAWVPLRDLTGSDHGAVCTFTGREGMIVGNAQIDLEMRSNFLHVTTSGGGGVTTYPSRHLEDTFQVGVFVNGVLVADSGPISPRRFTLDLPFACPAPPGEVTIETRLRLVVQRQVPHGYLNAANSLFTFPATGGCLRYPDINIFSTAIYARNKYR